MSKRQAPPITAVLIEWLEETYPERCPDPDDSDRDIWIAVGIQKLIKRLRAEHRNQSHGDIKHVHRT